MKSSGLPSRAPMSAAWTGPTAWLRMSQSRKSSTPVATAFRNPWKAFERPRILATGNPMKMENPAMAPTSAAVVWLIGLVRAKPRVRSY